MNRKKENQNILKGEQRREEIILNSGRRYARKEMKDRWEDGKIRVKGKIHFLLFIINFRNMFSKICGFNK